MSLLSIFLLLYTCMWSPILLLNILLYIEFLYLCYFNLLICYLMYFLYVLCIVLSSWLNIYYSVTILIFDFYYTLLISLITLCFSVALQLTYSTLICTIILYNFVYESVFNIYSTTVDIPCINWCLYYLFWFCFTYCTHCYTSLTLTF